MKRLINLFTVGLFLTSCDPDTIDFTATGSLANTLSSSAGTLISVPDSIARLGVATAPIVYADLGASPDLGVAVQVPVIPDDFIEPAGLVEQFSELAKLTGGETNYVNAAREITQTFIGILDTHLADHTDLVFMIDGTASMVDDIDNVKRGVTTLIRHVQMKSDVRVGVVVYRDIMDGPFWYSYLPLTTDYELVINFVNAIVPLGGGPDWPESVYDAACLTLDTMEWRPKSPKMMLVLGDAPALLPPRSTHTLEDVVVKSQEHGVDMNFYPVIITTYITPVITPVITKPAASFISKVYPNPTAGDVFVDLSKEGNYNWQITDVAGGILEQGNSYTQQIQVNLSGLPNGVYMVRITNDAGITESKMIVVTH